MTYLIERTLDRRLVDKMRLREKSEDHRASQSLAEIGQRLETFLGTRVDGSFEIRSLDRLSGGGANESYRFTLVRGSNADELVLRVKAPAGICATEVEREFQLLSAAGQVVPVPHPYWMTMHAEDFGEPAMICGKVPGVPSPTEDVPHATGLGTAYGPRLQERLAPQFVEHIANLHAYDWSANNLSAFDIPRPHTTDAIDWRLGLWNRSWDEDALESHPTLWLARRWLAEHRPAVDHVSLLHGDYRNGNFLFDEQTGEITAILDWELGYLGDRHSDLAYAMLPGWGHSDQSGHYLNSGLVRTEEFLSTYERISGLPVDRERIDYYLVLNLYWAVVSLIGTGPRHAGEGLTQLDVMYNFIAGLGGYFIGELNRMITKD